MPYFWAAADMVCWVNDVYPYNTEQARGIGGNNIVTVLMKAKRVNLQMACDIFQELMDQFMEGKKQLPS